MRSIYEPFVVARPAGARIRTRLRLSAADQAVVRTVGEHLGGLAGADLAWRCRLGQAAGAALAAAGVALLGEPRELRTGWVVEVADPWGNVIGLTDYRHTPERARRRAGAPAS